MIRKVKNFLGASLGIAALGCRAFGQATPITLLKLEVEPRLWKVPKPAFRLLLQPVRVRPSRHPSRPAIPSSRGNALAGGGHGYRQCRPQHAAGTVSDQRSTLRSRGDFLSPRLRLS